MKLWDKGFYVDRAVEEFTVGNDREMDLYLAPYDVVGSLAHIRMLRSIGFLSESELAALSAELKKIYRLALAGDFRLEEGCEDVHSQVEELLTRSLGEVGKKIHSGRSRNDQVLVDLHLFARDGIKSVVGSVQQLFDKLLAASERYRDVLMPGYTHLQIAMPSSFGLWFGAYAEALTDDVALLTAAYDIADRNPLGSAAGYGSSFPLNRQMTTELLGFEEMCYNSVYAQMTRGKMERTVAEAIASTAATLSRFAGDCCLFNSQNFGFVHLPDNCTTGSSIMPHKKNPDVFELLRGKCNVMQGVPQQLALLTGNLPSGYARDMQLTKELFLPLFGRLTECLDMASYAVEHIEVNSHIFDDERYAPIFSVEEVEQLTAAGMPFRDAYRKVAAEIAVGEFHPSKSVCHTHEGSIGNLCNDRISALMHRRIASLNFDRADRAIASLVSE